jgi:chorismate mutase
MNLTTGASIPELLALDNIRTQLIRLEDTIIFCASVPQSELTTALIERAQFARNKRIYEAGAFEAEMGSKKPLLEWFIRETESFHGAPPALPFLLQPN